MKKQKLEQVRKQYFVVRRSYGDTLRETKDNISWAVMRNALLTAVALGGLNTLLGGLWTNGDEPLGLLITTCIFIGLLTYVLKRRSALKKRWSLTFADFITERMKLYALCESALGGKWRLVYSNIVAPREKIRSAEILPLKAFDLDGGGHEFLGGTYEELKPSDEPIRELEQLFLHDYDTNRLLTFGSGKGGALVQLGGEKEILEFDDFPYDEVESAGDAARNAPRKRMKRLQSFIPLSDKHVDFLAKNEGAIFFGVAAVFCLAVYMDWIG